MARFRSAVTPLLLALVLGILFAAAPAHGQEGSPEPPQGTAVLPPPGSTPEPEPNLSPGVDWSALVLPPSDGGPSFMPPGQVDGETPAPPAVLPPAPAPAGSITYTVQRGDTLFRIALRFGVPVNLLAAVNGIANSHQIYAGQTLIIPAEAPAQVPPASPDEIPAGDPPPAPAEAPPPAPDTPPAPLTYIVQRGDTLYRIALRFSVTVPALVTTNNIPDPDRISVGQELLVPGQTAVPAAAAPPAPALGGGPEESVSGSGTYTVQRGDTLGNIAPRFGVTVADLVAANNIPNPNQIYVGQVLLLSSGAQPQPAPAPAAAPAPAPTPAAAPAAAPSAAPSVYVVQTGDTLHQIAVRLGVTIQALAAANNLLNPNVIYAGQQLTVPAPGTVPGGPPGQSGLFIWPVESRYVIQSFRYGHSAIDIVVPVGTTIWAAAGGVVEFAGWNQYGYGNLVVIDHQNGYKTLYAHQDSLLVASGDTVAQGDPIGLSGSTGRSNMPHLHFEIVLDWQRLNPCAYLPDGC